MTVAAGSISKAEEYLRASLAACASWQSATNTTTEAAAKEWIYCDGLPKPANGQTHTRQELQSYRPYAVVWTAEREGFSRQSDAVSDHFESQGSGQLMIRIVRDSPDSAGDEPTADANRTFKNLLGQICDEICDLAGLPGYLAIYTITLVEGPYWPPKKLIETQGLWQAAEILVEW